MLSKECWPSLALTAFQVAAVGACAGLVAGCDVNIQNGKASVGIMSAQAHDEWTHRYQLAPGGRVEVINVNGPVRLASGEASSVEVHATVTTKALTEAGAKEILARGHIQEQVEPARIRVETISPRGVRGSFEVRLEVTVPPDSQSDVSVTNGSVNADGLSGGLKVVAVNGNVELTKMSGALDTVVANGSLAVDLARVTAPVRLELTDGRLSLALPAASKANLSASIVNGALDVSGLSVEGVTGRRVRSVEAALNGGGPAVELRATNGRLSIEGRP